MYTREGGRREGCKRSIRKSEFMSNEQLPAQERGQLGLEREGEQVQIDGGLTSRTKKVG